MNIFYLILGTGAWCILKAETDGQQEANIEFIPRDILCPFCIALIERIQETVEQNPAYKKVLCESLSGKDRKNYDSCIQSFTDVTVEKLKNSSAEDLCKKQKLCSLQQKKVILVANAGKPNFPDIPPVTDEQRRAAEKRDILETFGDALDGKVENPSGKNLTLYIDIKFQRPDYNDTATSESSTTNSSTLSVNDTITD